MPKKKKNQKIYFFMQKNFLYCLKVLISNIHSLNFFQSAGLNTLIKKLVYPKIKKNMIIFCNYLIKEFPMDFVKKKKIKQFFFMIKKDFELARKYTKFCM